MQILAHRLNGSTSNIERVFLYKDSGAAAGTEGDPITGLTNASAGLSIATIANNEATANVDTSAATSSIEGITTLGTYATPTAGFVRFREVNATSMPGLYELQWENARYAVTSAKYLDISITGVADLATFSGRVYLDAIPVDIQEYLGTAVTGALLTGSDVGLVYREDPDTVTDQVTFIMPAASFVTANLFRYQTVDIYKKSTDEHFTTWIVSLNETTETIVTNEAPPFTLTTGATTDVTLRVYKDQHPRAAVNNAALLTSAAFTVFDNFITGAMRLFGRKDADNKTNESAALATINLDHGAGVGVYDPVTDSLEARADITDPVNLTQTLGTPIVLNGTGGQKHGA